MGRSLQNKQVSKFLAYVLGRSPFEFGLVPDRSGYIKIKELLKALSEEEGWRHVRRGLLDELLITLPNPSFEIRENLIRAVDREKLPRPEPWEDPPRLLYTCIREKAHGAVLKRGLFPREEERVVLSTDREFALRLGKRRDRSPVLLTVQTHLSEENGVVFYTTGTQLVTARFIPEGCFTAPPLPEKKAESKKAPGPGKTKPKPDPEEVFPLPDKPGDKKRQKGSWKHDKKRLRRAKGGDWAD